MSGLVRSGTAAAVAATFTRETASGLTRIAQPAGVAITFRLDVLDRQATRSIGRVAADTYR